MKTLIIAATAALAMVATPAMAGDFTGLRAEATAGLDDVQGGVDPTKVTYGAGIGLDAQLYKGVIVGVEATADNVLDRRNVAAAARVGLVVKGVLVFGKVGYASWKQTTTSKLEGLRVGGGLEAKIAGPVYGKVEYRYTDFDRGIGQHGALVGLGLRF